MVTFFGCRTSRSLAAAGLLAGVACNGGSPAGREPAAHAVHSEQLRAVMLRMNSEVGKRWPQEIQQEKEELRLETHFARARTVASELARASGRIPSTVNLSALDDGDRAAFMGYVAQLSTESRGLEEAAADRSLPRMHAVLKRVSTTCNQCHAQFRELIGPVVIALPES